MLSVKLVYRKEEVPCFGRVIQNNRLGSPPCAKMGCCSDNVDNAIHKNVYDSFDQMTSYNQKVLKNEILDGLVLTLTKKKWTPKVGNALASLTYITLASISDFPIKSWWI